MQALILTIQFMTRYPLPGKVPFTAENFVAGMKWMPVAGFLAGLPSALALVCCPFFLNSQLSAFVAVIALIWVTGALHLDGLGDTADGLFSNRSPEEMLAIMRDSTLGTSGVTAIVLAILLKFLLFASMPPSVAITAALVAPTVGRMALTWHAASAPYARTGPGLGEFVNRVGFQQAWAATLVTLPALLPACLILYVSWPQALLLFFVIPASAALFAIQFALHLTQKLGGITGDTIGATVELTELLTLFFFSLFGNPLL